MKLLSSLLVFVLLTGCALFPEWQSPLSPESSEDGRSDRVTNNAQLMEQLKSITREVIQEERGIVVRLQGLVFKTGASRLTPVARIHLRDIARILNAPAFSNRPVAVEGHTDSIGNDELNLRLSKRRAEVVAGELTLNKVPSTRIVVRGYGERFPLEANRNKNGTDSPAGRARNRRVELIIGQPNTGIPENSQR